VIRTFHHDEFDAARLAAGKGHQRIALCLPARNEAATVGAIVETIRRDLVDRVPLVDELLVVDDHSSDETARVATDAGARVVNAADVLPQYGEGHGKGEALWKSLYVTDSELIAWCDADVTDFAARFVVGLLGPLVTRPDIEFVKGFYDRPVEGGDVGGRVTELVARPLVSMLFPALTSVVQPLAGECAGRRSLLERVPFVQGYGVDLGLLLDIAGLAGTEAIAQVDLGTRRHRNRSLDELGPQALAVMQAALVRAGVPVPPSTTLVRPGREPLVVDVAVRPPLADVPGYRRRTA
jgi:glucosyl-3-phosphoglycerate synthase